MIKNPVALAPLVALLFLVCGTASATPSTHIWSPSTDIQADRTGHVTADMYVPSTTDATGTKPDTVTNLGLTGGLWPIENKLGIEAGFDVINGYGELDDHPLYFNAKIGTPEDALFDLSPALAFGGYNFGTEHDETDFNTYYVKSARTVKAGDFSLGRFSFGWFWGNQDLLLDENGAADDNGALLAWERTISELTDRLWLSVDYQGTKSGFGALSSGFSWKFADNVCAILAYVMPNSDALADSFTVQIDIDF